MPDPIQRAAPTARPVGLRSSALRAGAAAAPVRPRTGRAGQPAHPFSDQLDRAATGALRANAQAASQSARRGGASLARPAATPGPRTLTTPRSQPATASAPPPTPGAQRPAAGVQHAALAAVPYADLIQQTAARYGLDPALLAAIARTESNFNPRAVSSAGAQGLMQLMPATARGLGVADPFDPAQSLDGGARFLRDMSRRFGGDTALAVAAYNAGPAAVERHGGIPPFKETMAYVPKVMRAYQEFQAR